MTSNTADLIKKLLGAISSLANLNKNERQKTRDAVGGVVDELVRGLDLIKYRIEAAKIIAISKEKGKKKELIKYLNDSESKLFESFSEFKICRGLRERRDHFTQLFHPARTSVQIGKGGEIELLLNQLENDERLIFDEARPFFDQLRKDASRSSETFKKTSDGIIENIKKKQKKLKRLARKIHDKI